jgi:hypothetical protein
MTMMWVKILFLRGNRVIPNDIKSILLSFPGHQPKVADIMVPTALMS